MRLVITLLPSYVSMTWQAAMMSLLLLSEGVSQPLFESSLIFASREKVELNETGVESRRIIAA